MIHTPTLRRSLFALCGGAALSAHAAVVTFEGLPGATPEYDANGHLLAVLYASPLTTQGFTFTTPRTITSPGRFGAWVPESTANTTFSNYTGSTALLSDYAKSTTVTRPGGTFDLLSLDIANVYRQSASPVSTVTFTGTLGTGGIVTKVYTIPSDDLLHTVVFSGFDGLSSLLITSPGVGLDANAFQIDNLSVQAVPEPASLVVLGLGALGCLRRRRR